MLPNFNAKRVLIVENDLMFAEQSSQILQNAGYYIQVAYNSGDALYAVDNGHFDVALINTTMRDRNGDAILDQISTHPVFRRLPIVSFSGLDGRVTQSALPRPTTDDELLRHVAQAVRIRQNAELPIVEEDDDATQPRAAPVVVLRTTAEQQLPQQLTELKALSTLSRSLSSSLDLSEVLNQIVDAATSLTNAEEGLLLLPDEAGTALYIRAMKGLDSESARNFRIKTDDTIAGRVFTSGEPLLVGARGWQKVKTEYFVKSLLYVPLTFKSTVIGVLGVNNKLTDRIFTPHDQNLLLDLAAHAAIALSNASLYEKEVAQTRQLTTLVQAGRAVNSTLALDRVLSSICQQIVRALDVSGCLISELDPASRMLRALAWSRRALWLPEQGSTLDLDQRPTLKAALDQNAYYVISSERQEPNWLAERESLIRNGAHQTIVLPLRPTTTAIGVLELHYLSAAPEMTPEFRRQARATAFEIGALAAQRTTNAPAESAFGLAQKLITQTGAVWGTVWLINMRSGTRSLTRILDYGDAVWLDALRPEGVLFPAALEIFDRRDAPLAYTSRDEDVLPAARAAFGAYGAESLLCVPLSIKGTPIGAVTLYDVREPRHFTPQEIGLAQAIVSQAATAIENARLFRDLANSLTELKDAQIRLVQAARLSAIGELSAVVAHQIDNPLTAVLGNAELLLEDMAKGDPQYEQVATIQRAGKRAHAVVSRLLSMARQNGDKIGKVEINTTVQAVLELVTAHIQREHITLRVELAAEPLWTLAPIGQLEDVWLNLLLNARYATLNVPNAAVGIRVQVVNDKARVTVYDNGRGITPEHVKRIFEAFFTTKPTSEGTGLGLYICKQIIDRAGGGLSLESSPGVGTQFMVTLPLQSNG